MELRLAELLVGLSAVGDLAREREPGVAARSSLIACRLARAMGLPEPTVSDVFYAALLQHVACASYAREAGAIFGGRDVEMNLAGAHTDFSKPSDILATFIPELTRDVDVLSRIRIAGAAIARGASLGPVIARASCEVAEVTAERVGLGVGVQEALRFGWEWHNGRGGFQNAKGEQIPVAMRVVNVAYTAAVFHALGGADAATAVVRGRAGRTLDPDAAGTLVAASPSILGDLDVIDLDAELCAAEPRPWIVAPEERLDELALAFGEIVDLKTPLTHGSARRAFELAAAAASVLGLGEKAAAHLRRAAALRDVGKAAVSNAILEKDTPLTASERDQFELHAYRSEVVLRRSPALAGEAELVGLHHEREDGSGYHRRLTSPVLSTSARVLAAVDQFVEFTLPRPTRAGLSEERACDELRKCVDRREMDAEAVEAVVAAAQGRVKPLRVGRPAGLTERQVEVLRLVAQGLTNKQIAHRLVVSPRTAEHHVQDLYAKIGRSSRAGAAMFALQHQLL